MTHGMTRRRFLAMAACTPATGAFAQGDAYPSRPVRTIVPFPAGGGGDAMARLIFAAAGADLGQTFVIENLAGAGGNLGSAQAARAEPNGYTVLYGTNGTLGINHTLYAKPGFDPLKDLLPVCRTTEIPLVTVVRASSPYKTIKDLIDDIKARPGKLTFASAGNGTSSHLGVEIIKERFGLHAVHIPYRGGGAAVTDLIGGQVDFMTEVTPSAVPQIKGGRLRALAVTTDKRTAVLPDTPTYAEAGFQGISIRAWDGVVVPAGTSAAIVDRLSSTIGRVMATPEMAKQLNDRGVSASYLPGDAFRAFIQSEIAAWGQAVKRSGATVD